MKKILITLLMILHSPLLYAVELQPWEEEQSSSKLELIQEKIDKYTDIVNKIPGELQNKINNFDRLENIGHKVEQVIKKYLIALDSCAKKVHSAAGREACQDFDNLDLGGAIKNEKNKVMAAITEAERELENIRKIEQDIPMLNQLIESLQAAKDILMYGG